MNTVAGSVAKTATVNQQRENEVRIALERQRAKVLQIKQVREELTVLQRDVENAQRAYDTVTQKFTLTSMESQSAQANILFLNAAEPPVNPSFPKLLLNLAVSLFLGALIGVGAALLLELLRRRVRSVDDLHQAIDAPVIGRIREVPARNRRLHGWAKPASA